MSFWRHVLRQAEKEYSAAARLRAMAFEGLIFVFAIPACLLWLSTVGSERWRFELPLAMSVCCLVIAVLGISLGLWTVWVQFRYARGTPVPIMATKKLLTDGPYSLCRNPMALGTFIFYFGIAGFTSSFAPILAVFLFTVFLLTYIKLFEEKEMSLRFGDEYVQYKRTTPFIIPHLSFFGRKNV